MFDLDKVRDNFLKACNSGDYFCRECGEKMYFEDENEDTLICPNCGCDISIDSYGFDSDEDYNDYCEDFYEPLCPEPEPRADDGWYE